VTFGLVTEGTRSSVGDCRMEEARRCGGRVLKRRCSQEWRTNLS